MYHSNGRIEVITGPMFAGKTEELIRRLTRAQYANQKIIVFKPEIDNRYSDNKVVSHNGKEIDCIVTDKIDQLHEIINSYDVVAIDEVQFFDISIIKDIKTLADSGIRVIVTGLDTDFRGEPFGIMRDLICIAEKVDKLTAICTQCGKLATRTQRIINGKPAKYTDPVVLIGAKEAYEARCRECHEVIMK